MKINASIFSRFRLPQKFLILGCIAIAMTLMPIYEFFSVTQDRVAMAGKELSGLKPTKSALAVVKSIQIHRGLTAAVIDGNQQMGEQLPPVRAALDQAIATFDEDIASITSSDGCFMDFGKYS